MSETVDCESSKMVGFVKEAGRWCRSDKGESCIRTDSRLRLSFSFSALIPTVSKPGGVLGSRGCTTEPDDARAVEYEKVDDRNNELRG